MYASLSPPLVFPIKLITYIFHSINQFNPKFWLDLLLLNGILSYPTNLALEIMKKLNTIELKYAMNPNNEIHPIEEF